MTEEVKKSRTRYVLRGHRSDVNTICVNNEQDVLVSGSEDGCVRLWDLRRVRRSFQVREIEGSGDHAGLGSF